MNSFNHYSLGAVGAWSFSRILGIKPGGKQVGIYNSYYNLVLEDLTGLRGIMILVMGALVVGLKLYWL